MKVALTGRWRKYETRKSSSQAWNGGVRPGDRGGGRADAPGFSVTLGVQRERDPSALVNRALDGVDHLLDPRAILEGALVPFTPVHDLVDEVADQVGVEHRSPGLPRVPASRVEALGDRELAKLDLIRRRDPDRLRHAPLLDEPTDDRAAAAVEPGLDAGVVADRHEARLDGPEHAIRVLADEDVAVVDVHAHHPAGGPDDALRHEIPHGADDARVVRPHPPVPDVDDRRAVALEGRRLERGLVPSVVDLTERDLGI